MNDLEQKVKMAGIIILLLGGAMLFSGIGLGSWFMGIAGLSAMFVGAILGSAGDID